MFRFFVLSMLIVTFIAINSTEAQMFSPTTGARGATFSNQAGWSTSAEDVGTLKGSERFLRKNRSRKDFVGRDLSERKRFVGINQGQVSGSVPSSTAGLSVEMAQDTNTRLTPATASKKYMYDPRLRVDFKVARPSAQETAAKIGRRLEDSLSRELLEPVNVSVQEETATLKGQVATEHGRKMAALIVLLEPGISEIKNELTVVPRSKTPAAP